MIKRDNLALLRERVQELEARAQSAKAAQGAVAKDREETSKAWSGVFALLRELGKVETRIWQRMNGALAVFHLQSIDEASVDYGAFLALVRFLKARGQYDLIPKIEVSAYHAYYSKELRERLQGEENAGMFLLAFLTAAGEKGMTKKRLAKLFRERCAEFAAVLPEWPVVTMAAEKLPDAFRQASIKAMRDAEQQAELDRRERLRRRISRKTAIHRDLALLALAESGMTPSKVRDQWVEMHPAERPDFEGQAGTEKVKKALASIRQFIKDEQTSAAELRSLLSTSRG